MHSSFCLFPGAVVFTWSSFGLSNLCAGSVGCLLDILTCLVCFSGGDLLATGEVDCVGRYFWHYAWLNKDVTTSTRNVLWFLPRHWTCCKPLHKCIRQHDKGKLHWIIWNPPWQATKFRLVPLLLRQIHLLVGWKRPPIGLKFWDEKRLQAVVLHLEGDWWRYWEGWQHSPTGFGLITDGYVSTRLALLHFHSTASMTCNISKCSLHDR